MPPWTPSDPWPSDTPGGVAAPAWGGYVRLWVRAALAAGNPWALGPAANDRLDDGNVLSGATPLPRSSAGALWVDLSCDALDVQLAAGASSVAGIFTKPDAATCVVNLADPTRQYDPLNASSPWALGGHSRLVPATPVEVFAEVVDAATGSVTREWLFTGSADSWGEDWTPNPRDRVANLVATGETKPFVNMNRPETVPPVGDGDTVAQRVNRIVAEAGWLGDVEHGVGTVTLGPTALDSDGWELLNRTMDDELGFVYFTGAGALRWIGRATWFELGDPVLELGCGDGLYDVLVDASPSAIEYQLRNAVYAARTDGAVAAAISTASIERYGRYDYSQTDLGVRDDAQAAEWARVVLRLYAYPQISLADVTMRPALAADSGALWAELLAVQFVSDLVRIVWQPPDQPDAKPIDALERVVGVVHTITRSLWEVQLELVDANALAYAGVVFTLGPHMQDRLDAGFVVA
jgi:hypothetical protein